jgi:hypothetical protein
MVLWPLLGFALSNMVQPWGRVGVFDPPLNLYLRCSPIVGIVDATTAVFRILIYLMIDPSSVPERFLKARRIVKSPSRGVETWVWRCFNVLAYVIGAGGFFQFIKVVASPGLWWTKTWACFYLITFLVVEVITFFTKRGELGEEHKQTPVEEHKRSLLDYTDYISVFIAMLLTCVALTWADAKVMRPHPNLKQRWLFRGIRFSTHVLAYCVHAVLAILHSKGARVYRKVAFSTMALLFFILLIVLLTLDLQYTQVYFLWSIFITATSWFLFSFPFCKERVFFRAAGPSRAQDWTHVVAFDFFLRVTTMSIWWYVRLYDLAEPSSRASWVEFLG